MKNKGQEIGGFDVLSFQLEMLQTTESIFLFFFLLIPGALLPSYVWDKRCLFSLFHSCSLHTDERSHPQLRCCSQGKWSHPQVRGF